MSFFNTKDINILYDMVRILNEKIRLLDVQLHQIWLKLERKK